MENILNYFPTVDLSSKENAEMVIRVWDSIDMLRSVEYPIEEIFGGSKSLGDLYNEVQRAFYYWILYNKRLRGSDIPRNYPEREKLLRRYREEAKEYIGQDFEKIIKFIAGEEDIPGDISSETLKRFFIKIKPLLRKALMKELGYEI